MKNLKNSKNFTLIGGTMNKFIILGSILFSSFSYSADYCKEKQISAAKKIASKTYDSLYVSVVSYESGPWIEMLTDNHGFDFVTLAIDYLGGEEHAVVKYSVSAKQIKNTSSCVITKVMIEQ